MAFVLPFINC